MGLSKQQVGRILITQSMKLTVTTLLAASLLAGYSQEQEQGQGQGQGSLIQHVDLKTYEAVTGQKVEDPNATSWFEGIYVAPIAYIITDDFETSEDSGAGARVGYQITEGLGFETELFINEKDIHGNNIEGSVIDREAFNLTFTAPITKSFSAIPFGGIVRNYEDSIWGFNVGLRLSANVYKDDVYVSTGGRWLKEEDRDSTALFDFAVGYRF